MFLTLGLTADAAAAHRHEFSSPLDPSSPTAFRSSPCPPSTLRSPLPRPSAAPSPAPVSSLRASPVTQPVQPVASPANLADALSIMSGESEADIRSVDGVSVTDSVGSQRTLNGKKTKATPKPKTSFHLAHPPPPVKHKQRLHIRPRLLLQLQRISATARPVPFYDVLPSTVFAPRLARKFPRVFRGKDGLGANDIVIVSSEEYDDSSDGPVHSKDEHLDFAAWEDRAVVAAVCEMRGEGASGKTEVCLNHGPRWEAKPLPNGSYEFVSIDDHGFKTVARWVPRSQPNSRRNTFHGPPSPVGGDDGRRFIFSIVNPNTRRHPVIASMTRNSIDIFDQYSTPNSSIVNSPVSPVRPASVLSNESSFFDIPLTEEPLSFRTDESLRALILVTGIWVAFRENWSRNFKYGERPLCSRSSATSVQHPQPHPRNRPISIAIPGDLNREGIAQATLDTRNNAHHAITGKLLRHGPPLLRHGSSTSMQSISHELKSDAPRCSSSHSRRVNSTGEAFMERASNRSQSLTQSSTRKIPTASISRRGSVDLFANNPIKADFVGSNSNQQTTHDQQDTSSQCSSNSLPRTRTLESASSEDFKPGGAGLRAYRSGLTASGSFYGSTSSSGLKSMSTASTMTDSMSDARDDTKDGRRRWSRFKGLVSLVRRGSHD